GKPDDEKEVSASPVKPGGENKPQRGLKAAIAVFHYGFIKLLGSIASALLTGLILAALINILVPADFAAEYLKSDWLAMPAMLLFGIPLYVCSTASIPIAASLIVKGISPGAALVFLITGPATNITTVATMVKVLGKRAVVIYLFTVAAGAVIAGYILNLTGISMPLVELIRSGEEMKITPVQQISSIILLSLIAITMLEPFIRRAGTGVQTIPADLEIKVEGMTCPHCAASLQKAIGKINGVLKLDIDQDAGMIRIGAENPELLYPLIEKTVKDAGYSCSRKENKTGNSSCSNCCGAK
ncbi:MAG: permease, partial [Victivallaceae bacterium]|nr:permease [Victivallaceae bacterium]